MDTDDLTSLCVAILIVCLVACAIFFLPGYGLRAGTGSQTGQVTQIGRHGLICETYEATMITGGLDDGTGAMGKQFQFTIRNDSTYQGILLAMKQGKKVEVTYEIRFLSSECSGATAYYVDNYRVVLQPATGLKNPKTAN